MKFFYVVSDYNGNDSPLPMPDIISAEVHQREIARVEARFGEVPASVTTEPKREDSYSSRRIQTPPGRAKV
jgi:hypothetical protein